MFLILCLFHIRHKSHYREELARVFRRRWVTTTERCSSLLGAVQCAKVNLDSGTRQRAAAAVCAGRVDEHIFDAPQRTIQLLMETDSYKRFIRSDCYQHVLQLAKWERAGAVPVPRQPDCLRLQASSAPPPDTPTADAFTYSRQSHGARTPIVALLSCSAP